MTIGIVVDSTCDIPATLCEAYGITIVPLYINVGNQGYLDGIDISRQEFYKQLPHYKTHPTTAAPSIDTFKNVYEQLAQQGATEILSLHISVSLSATVDVARVAAQQTTAIPVTVLDSQQLSMGSGFLALTAAQAAREGRSLPEILALLDDQIARTHTYAMLDTLEYLKRSGRMSSAVAGLGWLLRIIPLLRMYQGNPTAERTRTRERAFRKVVSVFYELTPIERVALVHANAPEKAARLKDAIADWLPDDLDVPIVELNPVLGANIGPGVVGFACVTRKR